MTDLPGFPSRRSFLKASAAGVAISGFALAATAQPAPPIQLDQYQPVYFSDVEWAFVLAATARLIPSDGEGPGAIEAAVPVFIDRELTGDFGTAVDWYMQGPHNAAADPLLGWQTPLTPAQIYREAIPVVNAWCEEVHGAIFADLAPDQQDAVLTAMQEGEVELAPEIRDFFKILLQNTKEGYFADPIYGGNAGMAAWAYIGFPGARAAYKEWVGRHNIAYPLGPVSISGDRA
ncbi:gluconate 2-dehydrogenase subunit 3 family protein [Falsirhodobacter xinxiangensis]|uniref:gluconate 2-dehydrogenase subunit 3 family protein n=1 Tax=Falsirhodobacter xinxiangensis TaxID=2530049 RepID=UPI0010AACC7D|nr:gluconate 2-dehydrogenase subunit 3 family protein [Rhodobacter xinxiangensis]